MNRCIQCYRCVRFYRDYAGGRDFDAFVLRDRVFFGRHEDGMLESEFSGNLVEVCPTGVFTDKTLKQHYTRKWDERTAPSVCVHCGLGCNTIPGERYGRLRRIRNRYNDEVNGYFLCDRGRFGYEFVNSDRRLRSPFVRGAPAGTTTRRIAVERAASCLSAGTRAIGIGSPRASLEANFALRALVGPDRFYSGMAEPEHATGIGDPPHLARRTGALGVAARRRAVGRRLGARRGRDQHRAAARPRPAPVGAPPAHGDRREAAHSRMGRCRRARRRCRKRRARSSSRRSRRTRLDDIATATFHGAPDDLARLGFAVAHALDPSALGTGPRAPAETALVEQIARALRDAQRPLIVAGTGSGCAAAIEAAANVAWALHAAGRPVSLALVVPECNSLGAALLGGRGLDDAIDAVARGEADTLIVLENDLYRRGHAAVVSRCLDGAAHLIVLDHVVTPTTARADVGLSAGTFAEADGTFVNNEGRAQRFFQVFAPTGDVQESWRWIRDLMIAAGRSEAKAWQTLDDITAALASRPPWPSGDP